MPLPWAVQLEKPKWEAGSQELGLQGTMGVTGPKAPCDLWGETAETLQKQSCGFKSQP